MSDPDLTARIRAMVAARVSTSSHLFDDLVQEALIEWWRVHEDRPGQEPGYYMAAARGRVSDVLAGRLQMFGNADGGHHYRPRTTLVDWSDADNLALAPALSDDLLESIELAYHQGEIAEALNALSPADRAAVVDRFWHGKGWPEIETENGDNYGYRSRRWSGAIRPRLARHLQHLGAP